MAKAKKDPGFVEEVFASSVRVYVSQHRCLLCDELVTLRSTNTLAHAVTQVEAAIDDQALPNTDPIPMQIKHEDCHLGIGIAWFVGFASEIEPGQ